MRPKAEKKKPIGIKNRFYGAVLGSNFFKYGNTYVIGFPNCHGLELSITSYFFLSWTRVSCFLVFKQKCPVAVILLLPHCAPWVWWTHNSYIVHRLRSRETIHEKLHTRSLNYAWIWLREVITRTLRWYWNRIRVCGI